MQRKNFKTSAKKKYYIVKKGKNPGVYYNWPDCQKQVQGFPGAVYKGFVTREEAEAWYGKPVKEASHAPAVAPKKAAIRSRLSHTAAMITSEIPPSTTRFWV